MECLISVIVPIYNVESYLKKCIDSILNQTYKNIEVILVDDGSPDNCGKICDEYAKVDNRIKVIHKVNGGLSDARNIGIKISKGDYLMFVDSDDYINCNMCKILLEKAKYLNADIVLCNFENIYEDCSRKINSQNIKAKKVIYSNIEMCYKFFFHHTTDLSVMWNKIYKRDLFLHNNLHFNVGKLHEDEYIVYKLYYYANKIVILDEVLYYYLRRKNSITGKFSLQNMLDFIGSRIEQCYFAKDKSIELQKMIEAKSLDYYFDYCRKYDTQNKKIKNSFNLYKEIILKNKKLIFNNKYMNWRRYVKYFLLKLGLEKLLINK